MHIFGHKLNLINLQPAAFSLHLPASRASIRLLQACMCLWHLRARGPAEGIRRACGGPAQGLWRACRTQVQCLRRACAGPAEGLWVSRAIYGTVVLGGLTCILCKVMESIIRDAVYCHLLILWIHMKFTWIPSKVNPLKTTSQPKAKNHGFQSCDWGQVKNHKLTQFDFFGFTHFSGGEDMTIMMGALITSLN